MSKLNKSGVPIAGRIITNNGGYKAVKTAPPNDFWEVYADDKLLGHFVNEPFNMRFVNAERFYQYCYSDWLAILELWIAICTEEQRFKDIKQIGNKH